MKLLLDTHIWLWCLLEPERLSKPVLTALSDSSNELWLSPISVWEALLLEERGRIELDRAPQVWIDDALRAAPLKEAPLTWSIARTSTGIELPHRDPADRFLAATAAVLGLTLVTSDRRLVGHTDFRALAN